jgi:hypothetical protein
LQRIQTLLGAQDGQWAVEAACVEGLIRFHGLAPLHEQCGAPR